MTFLTACQDPNDTGIGILPDDDLINAEFVDTFSVHMKPILLDSVYSMNLQESMLGNYLDPEMGRISAETWTQFKLVSSNFTFGSNPANFTLDSVMLSIDLSGFYGRFDDPLPLQIYAITGDFPEDDSLFSNGSIASDTTYDFANGYAIDFSGQPGFFDFIEFRLDDSLGRMLLFAPEDSLISNTTFTNYFKGLHLRSQTASSQRSCRVLATSSLT